MDFINVKKQQFYSKRRSLANNRMPRILLRNIREDGWGVLHGPAVKAANTKTLVAFIVELAVEYFDSGSILHRSLIKLLQVCIFMFFVFTPQFPIQQNFQNNDV